MGVLQMNARELTDAADTWSENGILKFAGRFFMLLTLPAVTWLGSTVWDISKTQSESKGELSAALAQLRGEIAVLNVTVKTQMEGRYRDTDATRDFRVRDQKDTEQDRRIQENSERIRAVESRVAPPR